MAPARPSICSCKERGAAPCPAAMSMRVRVLQRAVEGTPRRRATFHRRSGHPHPPDRRSRNGYRDLRLTQSALINKVSGIHRPSSRASPAVGRRPESRRRYAASKSLRLRSPPRRFASSRCRRNSPTQRKPQSPASRWDDPHNALVEEGKRLRPPAGAIWIDWVELEGPNFGT